jgi:soluble lytic murein transglycosylase
MVVACHDTTAPAPQSALSDAREPGPGSSDGGDAGMNGQADPRARSADSELASVLWDPRFADAKKLHYAHDFRGEAAALQGALGRGLTPADQCAVAYAAGRAAVSADDSQVAMAMFDAAAKDGCPLASYAKVRGAQAKARVAGADVALAQAVAVSDAPLLEDERNLVIADCKWEKGGKQDAAPLYRAWLKNNPHGQRWVDVALKLAQVALEGTPDEGRAKEAFDLATRVLTEAPKLEPDKAEDLRRRAALARKVSPALTFEERGRKARGLLDTGEPQKALDLARSVLADTHAKPEEKCRSAMVRAAAEKAKPALFDAWSEAAKLCEKSDDDLVTALYNGAKVAASLKRQKEAIERFAHVEERFPSHRLADDSLFRAAGVVKQTGDDTKYEAMMVSIVDKYPTGDMADEGLFVVALAHLVKGDDAGARPLLDKIIAREAGQNRSWATGGRAPYFRARIAEREGKGDDAKRGFEGVVASVPLGYYAWLAQARLAALDKTAADKALTAAETRDEAAPADALEPEREGFTLGRRLLAVGEVELAKRAMARPGGAPLDAQADLADKVHIAHILGRGREWDDAIAFSRGKTSELYAHYPRGKWRAAWEAAYPRAFEDDVIRESGKNGVPAMLTWAIMREESSFMPEVKSPANAFGLMQLIPPTAKLVAQGTGLPVDEASLKRPEVSIALGTRLLGQLRATEAHPLLAIAAYNGGGGAVRRWLSELPSKDVDLFVELIPYDETRGYVKRVTMTQLVYAYLYDRQGFGELTQTPLVIAR